MVHTMPSILTPTAKAHGIAIYNSVHTVYMYITEHTFKEHITNPDFATHPIQSSYVTSRLIDSTHTELHMHTHRVTNITSKPTHAGRYTDRLQRESITI